MGEPVTSPAMPLCIYCRSSLDETTAFAHVFPEGLGGRIGSTETCCTKCNGTFAPLESLLCDALRPAGASIGALTGDRKRITHVRKVDGVDFTFFDGRADRGLDPPTFDRAKRRLTFPLPAGDEAQAELFANNLWQHGFTPDALDDGTFTIEPQENPHPTNMGRQWVENRFNVGIRDHQRVFAKITLELLARYDRGAARNTALLSARRFAREDVGYVSFKPDGASPGSGLLARLAKQLFVGHSAEVWTNGKHVLARVSFFGKLAFTGSLSPNWSAKPFSIAYGFDPRDPAKIVYRFRDRGGKPLAIWYKEADNSTIQTFESHMANLNNERAALAEATPVERAPMPVLNEAMKSRVRRIYEEIVAKKGPPKKRRSPKVQ